MRDEDTSLFCVSDGFDHHCPVKMEGGTEIFVGSVSFLAVLKVPVSVSQFLFMGHIIRRL